MKVLIPLNHSWMYNNPFVGILKDEFCKCYPDVEIITGVDNFWHACDHYDIIHIYWSQCLIQDDFKDKTLDELKTKILDYRANGTKIVSTCLNLAAHYSLDNRINESYDLVYSLSDTIIHLANYSLDYMTAKFPDVKGVVIEHHVYNTLYNFQPDRDTSLKILGLNANDRYILSFGTYRSEEERTFVFEVAKRVYERTHYKFLIPTLYPIYGKNDFKYGKKDINYYFWWLYFWWKMRNRKYIIYGHDYIDDKLPYYYAATDITFIQRVKILNSGNVPMGFFWGHIVVGTKEACVGDILRKTNNPTFDYKDVDSVVSAVELAINLVKEGKGQENRKYVMENCTVEITTQKIYNIYKACLFKV